MASVGLPPHGKSWTATTWQVTRTDTVASAVATDTVATASDCNDKPSVLECQ